MAGQAYLEARALYRQSVLTPKTRCDSDFEGRRGYDNRSGEEADYVAFCSRAVRRYRDMRRVVLEAAPLAMMGLETWLDHTDMAAPLPYYCLGDYRLAANALCQLLHIEEKDGKNEKKGLTYGETREIQDDALRMRQVICWMAGRLFCFCQSACVNLYQTARANSR